MGTMEKKVDKEMWKEVEVKKQVKKQMRKDIQVKVKMTMKKKMEEVLMHLFSIYWTLGEHQMTKQIMPSKAFHMNVLGCKDLKFISVKISAPGNSVNTDGIHIGESTGISIAHSIIGTGDDCISIGPGNNDINIFDVQCGPGHGISIGSLGKYTNEEPVKGVVVQHCTLIGTDNGVRIKTWPDSPKQGIATNLTFDDIIMKNVQNPIIIDQQYCPFGSCNQKVQKSSLIQISKVKFNNIKGTSASPRAISLVCSKTLPCQDVELSEINLKYNGGDASSTTTNVKPHVSGHIFPSLPSA
ncbi:hypothetical protein Syun_009071 [Stephania yunnanensis]|uniref:Exopolygalacturonase-like n=1 Tax=Stephania yunnanensis TaxID=152371 RepID=A0AAP0KDZ3_9MAGN